MNEKVYVAKVGKSVALKGENRLILDTDFPEQFSSGAIFETKKGPLEIEYYNDARGLVKFKGVNSPEEAKKLTNLELYTSYEASKEACHLEEGEYFWFDIIGCEVFENDARLGVVSSIDRLEPNDYLVVTTDRHLVEAKLPKQFLIPYIDHYVLEEKVDEKKLFVEGAKDILEAS